jgi:hypothetical protein
MMTHFPLMGGGEDSFRPHNDPHRPGIGQGTLTREVPRRIEAMFELFPRLRERQRQLAATLSGGEQQMLAIARAPMRGPTLLILDEPSLGLSPILVQTIYRAVRDLHEQKMTILLAEQSADGASHSGGTRNDAAGRSKGARRLSGWVERRVYMTPIRFQASSAAIL